MDYTQVNNDIIDRFKRLVNAKRLGHAYLFIGPVQSGKTQTALAIAQMVNCEVPEYAPCRACPSCHKIAAGNHPDVYTLGGDSDAGIKIDDIRQMLSRVALRPYEAKVKVFILKSIEHMTTDASNALLKTLEEPAKNTLMILTTAVPGFVLDTIKSRCHQVPFFAMPLKEVTDILQQEGFDALTAQEAAYISQGCLGKARLLAREDIVVKKSQWVHELLFKSPSADVLKELSADKDLAASVMQLCLGFMRDVLLFKAGAHQNQLINMDMLKEIQQMARRSTNQLQGIIKQIVEIKKMIDDNLNVKMSLTLLAQRGQE